MARTRLKFALFASVVACTLLVACDRKDTRAASHVKPPQATVDPRESLRKRRAELDKKVSEDIPRFRDSLVKRGLALTENIATEKSEGVRTVYESDMQMLARTLVALEGHEAKCRRILAALRSAEMRADILDESPKVLSEEDLRRISDLEIQVRVTASLDLEDILKQSTTRPATDADLKQAIKALAREIETMKHSAVANSDPSVSSTPVAHVTAPTTLPAPIAPVARPRAAVTADDFLPTVQGGPADIKEPAGVTIQANNVSASSAQDAMNAAVQENLKASSATDAGARMVHFPSGIGFVATGAGTYRRMEDPLATRIAKRHAYVVAFVTAKRNLAAILGGLSHEGRETVRLALAGLSLPREDAATIATSSEQSIRQSLDMMLRGFVIYDLRDDALRNTVYVSIVTTPKTRRRLARPAPHAIEVDGVREGIDQALTEVQSGLVPPVGGRIILLRSTGETVLVGFGLHAVASANEPAGRSKANLEGQKIAKARSLDALCGLMIGDRVSWEYGITEKLQEQNTGYANAAKGDPTAPVLLGVERLEKARQAFVASIETTEVYQSVRKGIIPAGVITKTWTDDDNGWVYAMSVYVPSASKAAGEAAREMGQEPDP